MNKTQLVEAVAVETNLSKIDARKAVDAVVHTTIHALQDGDKLTIAGFGTFCIQHKPARTGRNPRTGAAVKIPPRKVVKFRAVAEVEVE